MAAPVTHFEINARDSKRANQFYSSLFGWSIETTGDPTTGMIYGMVNTGVKMGINGGIGQTQAGGPPSVTFYVQVEDVQSHLERAVALGGRVIVPLTDVPGMVTFGQFADPEGNIVGIIKGPQTPPKEAAPKKKVPPKKKAAPRKKAAPKKKASRRPKPKARKGRRR
jgi:predicted enzyme related to lactoylglutathione lyase